MNKEMIELQRQLDIMTGKYEIVRGIADKAIKIAVKLCKAFDGDCIDCPIHNCDFDNQMQSQLSDLDK